MDEVIFRSSQKLETLQYQLGIAANEGKRAIGGFSKLAKNALINILNSTSLLQLHESIRELRILIGNCFREIYFNISRQISNAEVLRNLISIFKKPWSTREVYICCTGLLIGGIIGFRIGKAFNKHNPPVHYMRAIQCTNYSGIEAVTVAEDAIAPYVCDKHEVLINVKAASVHLIDAKICNGYGRTLRKLLFKYISNAHHFPLTLGRDCTGIIMDIGTNVKQLEVGDEVWVSVPFWYPGLLSQVALVSESKVARKPKSIGYVGACSLPYAGSVALETLDHLNLNQETSVGKRIFLNGACTPVGCILLQILKIWGAELTTSCYKRSVPVAKALGATDLIVLAETDAVTEQVGNVIIKELKLKNSFDAIINTLDCNLNSKDFQEFCLDRHAIICTLPKEFNSDNYMFVTSILFGCYVYTKSLVQRLFGWEIENYGETHMCHNTLDRLASFVESGKLQTVVDKIFVPHDIELALNHIQSPESIGSTIITFR